MGVSLNAYRAVTVVSEKEIRERFGDDSDPADQGIMRTYVLDGMEHGLEGLGFDAEQGVGAVIYGPWVKTQESMSEDVSFSYYGYNMVRERLSRTFLSVNPSDVWADPESFRGEALYDLINFADCEGTLGPVSCRRIASAFIEGGGDALARYVANAELDGQTRSDARREYERIRAVFLWAAPNGVVIFG